MYAAQEFVVPPFTEYAGFLRRLPLYDLPISMIDRIQVINSISLDLNLTLAGVARYVHFIVLHTLVHWKRLNFDPVDNCIAHYTCTSSSCLWWHKVRDVSMILTLSQEPFKNLFHQCDGRFETFPSHLGKGSWTGLLVYLGSFFENMHSCYSILSLCIFSVCSTWTWSGRGNSTRRIPAQTGRRSQLLLQSPPTWRWYFWICPHCPFLALHW